MKSNFVQWLALGVALSVIVGGTSCETPQKTAAKAEISRAAATKKIGKDANGTTVKAKIGENITLSLRECRGCVSVWTIIRNNEETTPLVSKTYSNASCTDCAGGEHDANFTFLAKQKGASTLSLKYFDDIFTVSFVVE